MVEMYVKLILNGRRTLEDIPLQFRHDVEKKLKEIKGAGQNA